MKKALFFFIAGLIISIGSFGQLPIYWQAVYQQTVEQPMPYNMIPTSDSGFILAEDNFVILKLDAERNVQWQQHYGDYSSANNTSFTILETADGYIAVGEADGTNIYATGNHGSTDYWVVKMDKQGNMVWQKSYGGSGADVAQSIVATGNGGYLMVGQTYSSDGDVTGYKGTGDIWVVNIDSVGNILWEKTYGGSSEEASNQIIKTSDGNFAFIGITTSDDGDVTGNHGSEDVWVVKINPTGTLLWEKCYGGTSYDDGWGMIEAKNHDFILSCQTYSNDGEVTGDHGNFDIWIVRTDSAGTLKWQKCLGGSQEDDNGSILETIDGGIFVGGFTASNDGDVQNRHAIDTSNEDFWAVQLDSAGSIQWQRCYGGSSYDYIYFFFNEGTVVQTPDGGLWCAIYTESKNGDVIGDTIGQGMWLIELWDGVATSTAETPPQNDMLVFPNPAANYLMIRDGKEEDLHFYDMLGQNLAIIRALPGADTRVDISLFPPMFLIKSESGVVKKVVRGG